MRRAIDEHVPENALVTDPDDGRGRRPLRHDSHGSSSHPSGTMTRKAGSIWRAWSTASW